MSTLDERARERYMHDPVFHARVEATRATLIKDHGPLIPEVEATIPMVAAYALLIAEEPLVNLIRGFEPSDLGLAQIDLGVVHDRTLD